MDMRLYIFLFLVLALAACDHAERPESPTAVEAERLNEAESMLDNMATNEEGPEAAAADPSNRN